jgi:hypothetical protein
MHIFLATTKREIHAQLLGVPSGAQYGGRLFVVRSKREGDTPQFLPEVFAVAGSSPGGI